MRYQRFIGVDSGKSTTRLRATDADGTVLWSGEGPGFSYGSGASRDARAIVASIREAAGPLTSGPPTRLCAGLTGLPGSRQARQWVVDQLSTQWSAEVALVGDAVTAHAGALGAGGTVVAAGTGAAALSITRDGIWSLRDGLGPIVGDRGSAYAIGLRGLRAAADWHDGVGPRPAFADEVLAQVGGLGLPSLQRLHRNREQVAVIALLARTIAAHADRGDEAAVVICREAGEDLAMTAVAAVHALGAEADAVVSYSGRLLPMAAWVMAGFTRALEKAGLELRPPVSDPLQGALQLARGSEAQIYGGLVEWTGVAR